MNSNVTLLLSKNLTDKKLNKELVKVVNTMNQYDYKQRNRIAVCYNNNLSIKFMNILKPNSINKVKLMSKIMYLSGISSRYIIYCKKHFNVPRPFLLIKNLQHIPVVTADSPSYPSGHSMAYTLLYRIFSDFDPKNKSIYKQIAYKGKVSRVIAGVHTYADIEGGEVLGNFIYNNYSP